MLGRNHDANTSAAAAKINNHTTARAQGARGIRPKPAASGAAASLCPDATENGWD